MSHKTLIEVDDQTAFFKLAKDLDPVGKIIVFEKQGRGRFKFLTKQHGELVAVALNVQESPYPVISPEGDVDHNETVGSAMRSDRDKFIYYRDMFQKLSIETRLESRVKSLAKGIGLVMGTNRTTRMDWRKASRNQNILSLKITTMLDRKNRVVINIKYKDQHTKELNNMLEKAGFRVVAGRIS